MGGVEVGVEIGKIKSEKIADTMSDFFNEYKGRKNIRRFSLTSAHLLIIINLIVNNSGVSKEVIRCLLDVKKNLQN
jgi:hypothetical protein